jgi:uncharacterized protein (DUF427 family)
MAELQTLAGRPTPATDDYWLIAELTPRWLRVVFGGETIADSKRALIVRESKILPVYYFPREDVRTDLLVPSDYRTRDPHKGEATYWTVQVGPAIAEHAAWSYQEPLPAWPDSGRYLAFAWNQMDAWFEEDEEVFVHPRDPYKRVDVMPSSRHVRVVVAGQTVAESRRGRLLFETGLPTRYYLPREDVRMDLLERSGTHSRCPYKGLASYWHVRVGDFVGKDFVWSYPDPIPECPKIRDLLCFFNERVEAIYVDGELQPRPRTKWALD